MLGDSNSEPYLSVKDVELPPDLVSNGDKMQNAYDDKE